MTPLPSESKSCAGAIWDTIPANMAKRKLRRAHGRKSSRRARRAHGAAGGKLPKGAVTLIVILRAREGQETLLEAELRAAAARSVGEPRGSHRTYAHASFLAVERAQRRAARLARSKLLEADRLRRITASTFGRGEKIAGASADFQIFRILAKNTHFNFMVAGGVGAGGRIADGVLGVQLAADFVDGFFNGAVLERGEVRAAGGGCGDFDGVVLHLIVNVLDGPDGERHQIDITVAVLLAGGRLGNAGLRGKRKRARRCDLRPGVFRLGPQFGAGGGQAHTVNGHVGELRLPQDFAELCLAADIGGFGEN